MIPELPLLRRELTELSSRRRTYIVRFVGAICILSAVMLYYSQQISMLDSGGFGGGAANPNRYAGAGGTIFKSIVRNLFIAVQMLMPALICGSITIEKERNTIGTLFVTRLSPMTIVLEKLCSRLVPMFTFLLLTFPVLAVVYSLGGVETTLLLGTLWLLFCQCLLYAGVGLLCSSWFATTVTAFIWSYVLTGLIAVFSGALLIDGPPSGLPTPYNVWRNTFQRFETVYGFTPMAAATPSLGTENTFEQLMMIATASLPSLLMTGVFVLLARAFLIRRAFISPSSLLLRIFKAVDGFFVRLNDQTTGGLVLMKDRDTLPLFDPVAWRERSKKSLGKARYLFRILVMMEGPTLFICVGTAEMSNRSDFEGLRGLLMFIWAIAAMILAMKGATIISTERVRETLDALLSTPLTAQEILTQKIDGMKRLMIVLAIPILSVHLTLLLLNVDLVRIFLSLSLRSALVVAWYAVCCVLTTFVTMRTLAWLSVLLGLRSESQSRAAIMAIGLISAWILVTSYSFRPGATGYQAIHTLTGSFFHVRRRADSEESPREIRNRTITSTICCLLRPDGGIQANEAVLIAVGNPYVGKHNLYYAPSKSMGAALTVSAIVLIWQILMLYQIRSLTLRLAPGLLGRFDQLPETQRVEPEHLPLLSGSGSEVIA
ncbi:MAG: ABC transporter permease subunit [Planctomycetaceae bacterium]|nr:ABC transporter permease subunit [Planctomycetaceae bacterium]